LPDTPARYRKWYSVTLYVNTFMEATYLLKAHSHNDAQRFVLENARHIQAWEGKQLSAESLRVKDKHLSHTDRHGFIA
jgi:hypothetical protein